MKAFTNLEQSKKLAEILPPESADMCYRAYRERGGILDYQVDLCPYQFASWLGVPCWSLPALLQIMPYCIDGKYGLMLGKLAGDDGWYVCYGDENNVDKHYVVNSNLLDACVEMILVK